MTPRPHILYFRGFTQKSGNDFRKVSVRGKTWNMVKLTKSGLLNFYFSMKCCDISVCCEKCLRDKNVEIFLLKKLVFLLHVLHLFYIQFIHKYISHKYLLVNILIIITINGIRNLINCIVFVFRRMNQQK